MSFFSFQKKPTLSFVFDIRDASLSVAVARFEKDKKPELILCQNFEFDHEDSKNHKKYLSSLLKTLDKAIISIRRSLIKIGNKEKIGNHYFFIGSPWSISQSKTIKIVKDKPFKIDHTILEKIIVGEELTFKRKIETKDKEPIWKVFEEKIIQSKLNGYKVTDILDKKTSNLTIELFVSFTHCEICEVKDKMYCYIDKKEDKKIRKENHSCILSSYSFFRDLYSNINDFIYVDVGKLITDVYAVRDDVIFGVASFPYGEENMIEASISKTNISKDVFMSHVNIGQDKNFELASHNNNGELLKTGFDIWKKQFKDALSKICTEMNIPNNMFVITNSVISSILIKNLSSDNKFEILGSKIEVSDIKEGAINNFIFNGKIFANEPYIKMDLVFLDKMLNKNNNL